MSCDFNSCDVHFTVFGFDVNCVSSLMSLACSWTHVDSLTMYTTVFAVVMFCSSTCGQFSLLCFWDVLVTCCT